MAEKGVFGPRSLVMFIDETGSEDYSDPSFPVFGYGGCAVVGADYRKLIVKPWRHLKRYRLGGADKPFHATEFQHSRPTMGQIGAINRFVKNPFFRFAAISSIDTKRPTAMDSHSAVAIATIMKVRNIIARSDVDHVNLIFEDRERSRRLIERDFDPNNLDDQRFLNARGAVMKFDCHFMRKDSNTPGLEVADLIVHTAGRQERLRRSPRSDRKFQPDFIEVFHGIHESYLEYVSVTDIVQHTDD
ncbi:MAG: DUF3800 domain-containing protein [Alphaproteobacteria bacterium]